MPLKFKEYPSAIVNFVLDDDRTAVFLDDALASKYKHLVASEFFKLTGDDFVDLNH